jgi:hypothetical protein
MLPQLMCSLLVPRTEVLQMLLRNTEYVAYAASAGKMFEYIEEAESKFNEVGGRRFETLINQHSAVHRHECQQQ